MAAFEWQRPAGAIPSAAAPLAAQTPRALLVAHGNCLVLFQDFKPGKEELGAILSAIPRVEMASLPTLPGFLPTANLAPNSERYVVGPVGLERFHPGIPPSAAGFHLGSEAQVASFRSPAGEIKLALFSYPTPQIAMQQADALQKVPGAMVKRSGPLVAVVLAPPDRDAAERLLSLVRYQAAVTLNERVPTRKDNIGNLILAVFELIGVLLVFALVSGIAFGGLRAVFRRYGKGEDTGAMILLGINREIDRPRE